MWWLITLITESIFNTSIIMWCLIRKRPIMFTMQDSDSAWWWTWWFPVYNYEKIICFELIDHEPSLHFPRQIFSHLEKEWARIIGLESIKQWRTISSFIQKWRKMLIALHTLDGNNFCLHCSQRRMDDSTDIVLLDSILKSTRMHVINNPLKFSKFVVLQVEIASS